MVLWVVVEKVLGFGILGAASGNDMRPRTCLPLCSTRIPGTKGHHLPASSKLTDCTTILAVMGWVATTEDAIYPVGVGIARD